MKDEALRLADELADWSEGPDTAVVLDQAAAELRRLSAENDALLEALKELTGHANERFSGGVWDRARAAIKQAEENT